LAQATWAGITADREDLPDARPLPWSSTSAAPRPGSASSARPSRCSGVGGWPTGEYGDQVCMPHTVTTTAGPSGRWLPSWPPTVRTSEVQLGRRRTGHKPLTWW